MCIRNAHQCCVSLKKNYSWLGLAATVDFLTTTCIIYLSTEKPPSPLPTHGFQNIYKSIKQTPQHDLKICSSRCYARSLPIGTSASQPSINSYDERIAIDDLHITNAEQFLVSFWLQCKHFSCISFHFVLFVCVRENEWVSEWVRVPLCFEHDALVLASIYFFSFPSVRVSVFVSDDDRKQKLCFRMNYSWFFEWNYSIFYRWIFALWTRKKNELNRMAFYCMYEPWTRVRLIRCNSNCIGIVFVRNRIANCWKQHCAFRNTLTVHTQQIMGKIRTTLTRSHAHNNAQRETSF